MREGGGRKKNRWMKVDGLAHDGAKNQGVMKGEGRGDGAEGRVKKGKIELLRVKDCRLRDGTRRPSLSLSPSRLPIPLLHPALRVPFHFKMIRAWHRFPVVVVVVVLAVSLHACEIRIKATNGNDNGNDEDEDERHRGFIDRKVAIHESEALSSSSPRPLSRPSRWRSSRRS